MRRQAGFSILELMVTLSILAILAAIAIPGFIQWRTRAQLSYAAQDVYANLQKAKSEAARRNSYCAIIINGNEISIFIDTDQSFTLNGGETVIKFLNLSDYAGVRLDASKGGGDGLTFANPSNAIAFAPNGFPMDNTDTITSGTVFLTNDDNEQASIDISPAGNVRIN